MRPAAYLRASATSYGWADAERNLLELIFETVHLALERSATPIGDVDSVVLSAHDMVDGRSLTSMTTAPAAGAYLKEEIRLGEDGAAALGVAVAQILAGQAQTCIVAAWGRASEGDGQAISNALFDPFFAQPLGMTELAVSALRASKALRVHASYAEHRGAAAARRRELADGGIAVGPAVAPPAPLRPGEAAPPADVVCALVVSADETDVRVAGTGISSEAYWPGDRALLELPGLREAARKALHTDGRREDEVIHFELDGLTLFDEALALEAVGAAQPGDGMNQLTTRTDVNAAGGYARGACAPAMGLVRAADAAAALRAVGEPGLALTAGASAVASQIHYATVLDHA